MDREKDQVFLGVRQFPVRTWIPQPSRQLVLDRDLDVFPDVAAAYLVREHRHSFKNRVYAPTA